jgi:hypothetical protein
VGCENVKQDIRGVMTAHGSKKKRSQEDLYGVGQQPQQQVKRGRHGGNKTQNRSTKTPTTNSSPEQSSPGYISPYNCAKTLLSEEEIALLVLSNNFLTSLSLETNPCFESSSEALQSSYALEKLFLEHYVSFTHLFRVQMIFTTNDYEIGNQNSVPVIRQAANLFS